MDYRSGGNWDIYGTQVTPTGTVSDSAGVPIATDPQDEGYPALASAKRDRWLVAYHSYEPTTASQRIMGRTITWEGQTAIDLVSFTARPAA
jgi:hypothetical protein